MKRAALLSIIGITSFVFTLYALVDYASASYLTIITYSSYPMTVAWFYHVSDFLIVGPHSLWSAMDFAGPSMFGVIPATALVALVLSAFLLWLPQGWKVAAVKAFLLLGPSVSFAFEVGIMLFDPAEYGIHATAFLGSWGLGWVTNALVAGLSWASISGVFLVKVILRR